VSAGAKLPTDPAARKAIPIVTGVLDYFPLALAAVAECSRAGNEQHNPGQPLHWAKEKSTDHADTLGRHLIERGTRDTDGIRHSAKVAWRALALLETEIEAEAANEYSFTSTHLDCRQSDLTPWVPAVGDMVRILKIPDGLREDDGARRDYNYLIGSEGKVSRVFEDGYLDVDTADETWCYLPADLELVAAAARG
jgi:hypothetical protein